MRNLRFRALNSLRQKSGLGSAVVTSFAIAGGYMHYQIRKQTLNVALCEPTQVKENTEKQAVVEAKVKMDSIFEALLRETRKFFRNVNRAYRYFIRLTTYFLYGVPLSVLLPFVYTLGSAFPPVEEFTWEYMRWSITKLGPCFIKLAQWASTRPDIFAPLLIEKLSTLQDDVQVAHSMKDVERTMTESFGINWRNKLAIDPTPMGAGSVAQVYKGILKKTGSDDPTEADVVAIKLIHPHVEKQIEVDMELLSSIADFIDTFPDLEILSIGETCRQFAMSMRSQIDLRTEAQNLKNFGKNFAEEKWAIFPQPIEGLVTKNVLVETLMEGLPLSTYMNMKSEVGSDLEKFKIKLSDLGVRLVLKMIFFDNFIHGDLHPGNLFVSILPGGEPRIGVIDCGIVYFSNTAEEHQRVADICFAFMEHDGLAAGNLMLEQAQSQTNRAVENVQQFCTGVQSIVKRAETEMVFDQLGSYVSEFCNLARSSMVRLDPGYFNIAMSIKVVEGTSLSFNRDLNLVTKCVPIILQARAFRALGVSKFPHPEGYDDEIKS